MPRNQQILLDSRPEGEATVANFKLVTTDTPALADGQVLVRHHYLSLDPYMRGRMNDSKSYAASQPLGEVMIGGTVGEVVDSKHPKYKAGDQVVGMGGWQEYSVVDANQPGALRKVDTTHVPLSYYLGAVGMPGVTAWYGLVKIINPKAGETVVISAATGAVGSAFGALAKARGCRVVGIAGGPDKCAYAVNELGFDACLDYKLHKDMYSLAKALKEACPNGIDGYFENVGGMILDAVLLPGTNEFTQAAVQQIGEYFAGTRKTFSVPLHAPGTAFQQRVWAALREIPFGEIRSYGEIAAAIGEPKAVRAVGTANGMNRIAILIPCHRVIGANGALTGYGGGLWRKDWLLKHEREHLS